MRSLFLFCYNGFREYPKFYYYKEAYNVNMVKTRRYNHSRFYQAPN